jgi:hypothetical protein
MGQPVQHLPTWYEDSGVANCLEVPFYHEGRVLGDSPTAAYLGKPLFRPSSHFESAASN